MARASGRSARQRVGRVSYYPHHGGWYVYYREHAQVVRRRVAATEADAERVASQINGQLAVQSPSLLGFQPIGVAALRQKFLDHHEHVLRSSLATIERYRAATQHLENFAVTQASGCAAHALPVEALVAYLRRLHVAPNGHANARRRPLRDKGIHFILECCRNVYSYAQRQRHLPPYAGNPFANLRIERLKIEDAKPIFIFDAAGELAFFRAVADWAFPIHFTLAKTGMRPGELVHLLIEEVDLKGGWLLVRGKPALGWRTKTGSRRSVPLVAEVRLVLRRVIGERLKGLVFLRPRYSWAEAECGALDLLGLERCLETRLAKEGKELSRREQAKVARALWQAAGMVKPDAIRQTFVRAMTALGRPDSTCPKSWRHTFATLLQDANVDPLIRQITLGHQPGAPSAGALGMTSVYTHTRPVTQSQEIERAIRMWPQSLEFARAWAQGGSS